MASASDTGRQLATTVERIQATITAIYSAHAAPDAARKELAGASIGHKNWDGYGLRDIRGKDLHDRALAGVTDYLIADLTERKRSELKDLADTLDQLTDQLVQQAKAARFDLVDIMREAREAFSGTKEARK